MAWGRTSMPAAGPLLPLITTGKLDLEAERRPARLHVEGVLEGANRSRSGATIHDRLIRRRPDAVPLCFGIDGDRPHAGDGPALVEGTWSRQEIRPSASATRTAPDRGMRDEVARGLFGC